MLLANIFVYFFGLLGSAALETFAQLLCLLGPFVAVTLLLHWLEVVGQQRLAERFGWRAVLWTGWLGTPIHELSHAALCVVFWHRIEKMALFEPDVKAGRLGYVMHAYDPRNVYQVVGNFFIGIAPLIGGTLVLFLVLLLFEFDAAKAAWSQGGIGAALKEGKLLEATGELFSVAGAVLVALFRPENLLTWQLWVFLYLALCVSSHMAPSPEDYAGAWGGGLLLLAGIYVLNVVLLAIGLPQGWLLSVVSPFAGPVLAIFGISAALCGAVTAMIVGLEAILNRVWGPPQGIGPLT
jgi:hypothetical protein